MLTVSNKRSGVMLNKRLISFMKESMIYVYKNVFTQWIMLLLNIIMMAIISFELENILIRKTFKFELLLFIFNHQEYTHFNK